MDRRSKITSNIAPRVADDNSFMMVSLKNTGHLSYPQGGGALDIIPVFIRFA